MYLKDKWVVSISEFQNGVSLVACVCEDLDYISIINRVKKQVTKSIKNPLGNKYAT
jgi:hypothetical protein